MIEQAARRGIYDALHVADLETALAETGPAYDLLIAADTLVYLGDLGDIFSGAARHLRKDGFFLFTVERGEGDGFELGPKRRYRHGAAYLRRLAERHGFDVAGLVECTPRQEAGQPVAGFAAALQRA
jgi:predicted TPR repeat methyltransferase